jgi:hypothetical protein
MVAAGSVGKYILGGLMVLIGLMILAGLDKSLETWLVANSPMWLTELTTRY